MVTHHFYITHNNSNESVCVYFTTTVEHPNDKGSKNNPAFYYTCLI